MYYRIILGLSLLALILIRIPAKAEDFTALKPSIPAPNDAFSDALGQQVRFADFKGRYLLVNFWATWCPPCVKEMPSLDRLAMDFYDKGLDVVAISLDRSGIKKVAPFYRSQDITSLKIYLDDRYQLARQMNIQALPFSFLIDRNGQVVARLEGARDWDDEDVRNDLLHRIASLQ